MKQIFASADYGLIGLGFFFIFFVLMAAWTLRPSAKKTYEKLARIPLEENE